MHRLDVHTAALIFTTSKLPRLPQARGGKFTLEVDGVGKVKDVTKDQMMPVEYEDEDGDGDQSKGGGDEEVCVVVGSRFPWLEHHHSTT